MDNLSGRTPLHFDDIGSLRFDYVEELAKLQSDPTDASRSLRGLDKLENSSTVHLASIPSSRNSCILTAEDWNNPFEDNRDPGSCSSGEELVGGRTLCTFYNSRREQEPVAQDNKLDVNDTRCELFSTSEGPLEDYNFNLEAQDSPTLLRYATTHACSALSSDFVMKAGQNNNNNNNSNEALSSESIFVDSSAVHRCCSILPSPLYVSDRNSLSPTLLAHHSHRFKRPSSGWLPQDDTVSVTSDASNNATASSSASNDSPTTRNRNRPIFRTKWNRYHTKRLLNALYSGLRPVPSICRPTLRKYIVDPRSRLDAVNYMLGIQSHFYLKAQTVHLAVGYFDRYLCIRNMTEDDDTKGLTTRDWMPVALACLKIADLYNEISKEYYKQDNITEYTTFSSSLPDTFSEMQDREGQRLVEVTVTPALLLAEEKRVLNTLQFGIAIPTVCWFLDAFLSVAKLLHITHLVDYCHYLADLSLYSHQLVPVRPALKAQVIILIGCCSLFRPTTRNKTSLAAPQHPSHALPLTPNDPNYLHYLEELLCHFVSRRDTLCEHNTVWAVLHCVTIFRDLLINGRRYFEVMKVRSVERSHPWASHLGLPTTSIPTQLIKCILPSTEDTILSSLS